MTERAMSAAGQGKTPWQHGRAETAEPTGVVAPRTIGLHDGGTTAPLVRVRVPDQPGVLNVLTDPVQADVMTLMLAARTATFEIRRQRGHRS